MAQSRAPLTAKEIVEDYRSLAFSLRQHIAALKAAITCNEEAEKAITRLEVLEDTVNRRIEQITSMVLGAAQIRA